MACVCKDNDWESSQSGNGTSPLEDPDCSPVGHSVAFDEMRHDENDQVRNGEQGNDASVFERIQAAEEREWDDDEPASVSLLVLAKGNTVLT